MELSARVYSELCEVVSVYHPGASSLVRSYCVRTIFNIANLFHIILEIPEMSKI